MLADLDSSSVAAIIADPPYGINMESHGMHFRNHTSMNGDHSTGVMEFVYRWSVARGLCLAMFFSPYHVPPFKWRNVLVWNKGAHVGIGGDRNTCWKRDFEMIGVANNKSLNGRRDSAVLNFNAVLPPPSGHVAEKPVSLLCYLIKKLTNLGEVILDPCMGSGATGEACLLTGRKFIGIENDPKWFDAARDRLYRHDRALQTNGEQLSLFDN